MWTKKCHNNIMNVETFLHISHAGNVHHDPAIMLPRCPASSTHQTEYLNDSALMLPKPVVYPVTLTQQTEYVQNDSLMMPEPARL